MAQRAAQARPRGQSQGQPQPVAKPTFVPPTPTTVKETGLNQAALVDLAIKIMYFEGNIAGYTLAERMKLPFPGVVEDVVEFLRREKL